MKWSTTTYWDIRIDRLGLWLKEDFHYLKNNETYVNLFHPELISHFKSKSLIEVLTLVSLDLTIQTKGECTEVILNCLRNQNDNTNQLNMSIRPDSLQTLIKAASLFGDDLSRELYAPFFLLLTCAIEQHSAPNQSPRSRWSKQQS